MCSQLLVYAYITVLYVHQIGGHLSTFFTNIYGFAMALLFTLLPITELDNYMHFILYIDKFYYDGMFHTDLISLSHGLVMAHMNHAHQKRL